VILSQLRPAPTASITANTDDAFLTHSEIYKSVGRSSLITTINTKTSIFTKLDLLIEKVELTKTQVRTVLTIFQKIFSMSLYLQRRRWKTSNVQKLFFFLYSDCQNTKLFRRPSHHRKLFFGRHVVFPLRTRVEMLAPNYTRIQTRMVLTVATHTLASLASSGGRQSGSAVQVLPVILGNSGCLCC
jgi:hypothetical protein